MQNHWTDSTIENLAKGNERNTRRRTLMLAALAKSPLDMVQAFPVAFLFSKLTLFTCLARQPLLRAHATMIVEAIILNGHDNLVLSSSEYSLLSPRSAPAHVSIVCAGVMLSFTCILKPERLRYEVNAVMKHIEIHGKNRDYTWSVPDARYLKMKLCMSSRPLYEGPCTALGPK